MEETVKLTGLKNTAEVIADYASAYPDPLILNRGDRLRVCDKESEWPGWLWCMDTGGKSGWVPAAFVECKDDCGIMLCDYDATELTVKSGERLDILVEESGWVLAVDKKGQKGWVPGENIKISD